MARKREEMVSGCMARAGDEEMTFVLLSRDPIAPVTIRNWAAWRVEAGKNTYADEQIAEAYECADVMAREGATHKPAAEVPPSPQPGTRLVWTSAESEMPERGQWVLTSGALRMHIATWHGNGWETIEGSLLKYPVTHWMPLPDAPDAAAQEGDRDGG
jgi:hypothetical protein